MASCTECVEGKYQSQAKQMNCTQCKSCPAGGRKKCGIGNEGYCTNCPPGQFVDRTSNITACSSCPLDYYQPVQNQPSCNECSRCAVGLRAGCGGAIEGFCEKCYPGRFVNSMAEACADCPGQYFQVAEAQPNCSQCPVGKFQNKRRSVYCEEAPSGMALRETEAGEYEQVSCKPGTFSNSKSGGRCEECPTGRVQHMSGRGLCEQCSIYQYIRLDAATEAPDKKECIDPPARGIKCTIIEGGGFKKTYVGSVWHAPHILNPTSNTSMYTVSSAC
jgi:hypothetical protein